MDPLALDTRTDAGTGLPEALRVLLAAYPRAGWAADPQFHGLVSFWLERHQMFRKLLGILREDTALLLDRQSDPQTFAARLGRFGGMFVNELHGHHQIEDQHYFPLLAQKDARIIRGFDILDSDHHALDGLLDGFVKGANALLQRVGEREALQTATGRFAADLDRLERLIDRHLTDEEDLIVPVILHHGTAGLG
ncbi:MAG: hemerythrin domain-containing protein [Rhodobacterales bacterium]|nr:hemerythrin domain-containing protein [Rhodobacterales bacterium]